MGTCPCRTVHTSLSSQDSPCVVGAGAGVGAVIGGLLGGTKGAIAGILAGAGGTIAATEGKQVELPTGQVLRVKLDVEQQ